MQNLKFRRQFILTNRDIIVGGFWNSHSFDIAGITWILKFHPDLEFSFEERKSSFIILLGYILDPENPDYDNKTIIREILSKGDFSETLACSNKYNGRYVIIYKQKENFYIFHDATGFREVYYTFENNILACGSTPNILAENFGLQKTKDPEINSFFNSKAFRDHACTWIGYKTLYENIMHLPPNHYLDLQLKKIKRYWPLQQLQETNLETCAEECARILKGTFASAFKRYKLHLGITAGWDTRLLLAASKEFKEDIYYYVNKLASYSDSHPDIKISQLLSEKLGFKLNMLEIPSDVDNEFKDYFYANNVLAHETHLPIFYNAYKNKWDYTHTVSGAMGNGLARIYMLYPKGTPVTGKNISKIAGYSNFRYVINELNVWAEQVLNLCVRYHVNIMDLYQLEQENAHWASLTSSEQDIVREEIRPFNNRKLIKLFWSLDDKYRYQYHPEIYIKMMKILWEDTLKFPINPSLRSGLYKLLRTLGVEQKVNKLYKRLKFKIS